MLNGNDCNKIGTLEHYNDNHGRMGGLNLGGAVNFMRE